MIHFCYDDLGKFGIGYPNLARPDLDPDQFDTEWPRAVPLRLHMHFTSFGIPSQPWLVENAPQGAWYPIALAWHDFACDYIGLLSARVKQKLRQHEIQLLIYYHEGDNPRLIEDHLKRRCAENAIPTDCFLVVSANSAADSLTQTIYFPDHEYFFRWINRRQHPTVPAVGKRPYRFTVLNRLHKTWRALVMSDLNRSGLLDQSLWSYNTQLVMTDSDQEHPLDLSVITNWNHVKEEFLRSGPYVCDSTDGGIMNDHARVNTKLFTESYFHVIIETMMDADGSGGCFLTEKTFKCIKYGQPFVIIGTNDSLAQLRSSGYRTFDHVIDPTYDTITDPTKRYLAVKRVLNDIVAGDPQDIFARCLPDVLHNQDVFLNHKSTGLSKLVDRLTNQS